MLTSATAHGSLTPCHVPANAPHRTDLPGGSKNGQLSLLITLHLHLPYVAMRSCKSEQL